MAMKLRVAVRAVTNGGYSWSIQCEQADGSQKTICVSADPSESRDGAVASINELLATLDAQGVSAHGLPVVDEGE